MMDDLWNEQQISVARGRSEMVINLNGAPRGWSLQPIETATVESANCNLTLDSRPIQFHFRSRFHTPRTNLAWTLLQFGKPRPVLYKCRGFPTPTSMLKLCAGTVFIDTEAVEFKLAYMITWPSPRITGSLSIRNDPMAYWNQFFTSVCYLLLLNKCNNIWIC